MIGKKKGHSFLQSIGFTVLASALFVFANAESASAHGYIESPKSRALLCAERVNTDCGAVIYEPQSLEAPKGSLVQVFQTDRLHLQGAFFHN